MEERTVDGDSHYFCEDETIGTDEGWNAVEGIYLDVVGLGIWWLSVNEFNVEVVGFGNRKQNCGSGIALRLSQSLLAANEMMQTALCARFTYFVAVKLSERHFDDRTMRSLSAFLEVRLLLQLNGLKGLVVGLQ